jgi:hypothetical protein
MDPDRALVVNGAEVKKPSLALAERRDRDDPAVPAGTKERSLAHPALGRLGHKRYADLSVPLHLRRGCPGGGQVEGEVPQSIEGLPAVAAELRARIPPAEFVW